MRIAELIAVLQRKQTEYHRLEDQIAEYVRNAEIYEQQLIRKEKEKAKLLLNFRKIADSGQNSVLTLEELEAPPEAHFVHEAQDPKEVLADKRRTVEMLRATLADEKKKIRNLRDDNELLRNALAIGFSGSRSHRSLMKSTL